MGTGGLVIRTSEVGERAVASEKARKALQERGPRDVGPGVPPPSLVPPVEDDG